MKENGKYILYMACKMSSFPLLTRAELHQNFPLLTHLRRVAIPGGLYFLKHMRVVKN